MKKKRILTKIFVFALVLCIGVLPYFPATADSDVLASILFTNDSRGFSDTLTYIERYKENTPNSILVHCGNFTKGSAEASFSNAKYSSELMKEAEYDLISLGTDDFSYGYRALKRYVDYTGCTMLSGNVNYSSAEIYEKSVVKTVGGLKIGFFSLVDAAAKDYLPSARSDGYHFENEMEFAKEQVKALSQQCDKIICLASFLENQDVFTPEKLVEEVKGLDVLICSNLGQECNAVINDTLVLSAGEKLASLGVVRILSDESIEVQLLPKELFDEKGNVLEETDGTYQCYGQSLVFNTAKEKILKDFEKNITDPIAKNKTTIYGVHEDMDISLVEETPLGDLFADAMTLAGDKLKSSDTALEKHRVVSLVNGTAIKNNIMSGDITLRNVFDSAQIAEDVYFYEVNAAFLFEMMEESVAKLKYDTQTDFVYAPDKRFLQISGLNVLIDPTKPSGERIERMYLINGDDETDVTKDDDTLFLLAVNESLAKGAEGYTQFLEKKPIYIGDFLINYLRTAIASAVNEDYYVSPGTESRITFKRIKELQPNGDAWATIDNVYEEHAACEVLVDGIESFDCSQVDENGEVRITLKTGAHGVSVNGYDTYLSTETGLGIKKNTITPIVDYKLYYKTLDDAYKIDEDAYQKEAVDGYFEYLSRAYVETKLTEEGEVVKATQDIFNVWDDFLENPNAFIKQEDAEEADDDEESAPYPNLDDFAYQGSFQSTVFENTPSTASVYSLKSAQTQEKPVNEAQKSSGTGDSVCIVLIIFAVAFAVAGSSILCYILIKKRGVKQ